MSALAASQSQAGRVGRVTFTELDEQGLVAAVRRGDDRAFEELYARYGRRIVSYIFGMVGDHGRAEDIAQEAFISALRRMRATERPIAFKPWIYEIAKNACIDEFRRARRAQEVPLESDHDSETPTVQHVAPGQSADASFERRQQLDDLRGAFRGLSENHHKILVLRELEGLSYAEIGRRMGMTRPVVESTLFRARRRLGQEYEEIASGQRCEQVRAVIDTGGASAVRALGVRERRRLTRHVSHCQPCRRHAWMAGVDESVLRPQGVVEKIAALLPIPAFLRWRRSGPDDDAATASGSHSVGAVQSVQTVAQMVGPGSPVPAVGRAAAAVVAIAIAGGGVATVVTTHGSSKPAHVKSASVRTPVPPAAHRQALAAKVAQQSATAGPSATFVPTKTSSSANAATPTLNTAQVGRVASQGSQSTGQRNSTNTTAGPLKLPPLLPPTPQIQLPKVQVPQVNLPQVNLPSVKDVVNSVPNVVKTVTNTFHQLGLP